MSQRRLKCRTDELSLAVGEHVSKAFKRTRTSAAVDGRFKYPQRLVNTIALSAVGESISKAFKHTRTSVVDGNRQIRLNKILIFGSLSKPFKHY